MALGKRGFTLFETLIAALVLSIVGSAIAGVYIMEGSLLVRTSHRLEAMNFARSVADRLTEIGYSGPVDGISIFSLGQHTETTNPQICVLPDSYFKLRLNGKLKYNVDQIAINKYKLRRVEIIVEWDEAFPKRQKVKESLFIIANFQFVGGF